MNKSTRLAIYYLTQYPIGSKIYLNTDYPWLEPVEVIGVIDISGKQYLKLSDGREVYADNDGMIKKIQ